MIAGDEASSASGSSLPEHLFSMPFKEAKQAVVDQFERGYLEQLMSRTDGNLSRAAGEAEITRYYLRELLKRLGLHKSSKGGGGE